jgi:hypothetical protein
MNSPTFGRDPDLDDQFDGQFDHQDDLVDDQDGPVTTVFGSAPVDPMVFHAPTDAPELRAAAAYVPLARPITPRPRPPQAPEQRDYGDWVPRGFRAEEPAPGRAPLGRGQVLQAVLSALFLLVPLAVVAAAVIFGLRLVGYW